MCLHKQSWTVVCHGHAHHFQAEWVGDATRITLLSWSLKLDISNGLCGWSSQVQQGNRQYNADVPVAPEEAIQACSWFQVGTKKYTLWPFYRLHQKHKLSHNIARLFLLTVPHFSCASECGTCPICACLHVSAIGTRQHFCLLVLSSSETNNACVFGQSLGVQHSTCLRLAWFSARCKCGRAAHRSLLMPDKCWQLLLLLSLQTQHPLPQKDTLVTLLSIPQKPPA